MLMKQLTGGTVGNGLQIACGAPTTLSSTKITTGFQPKYIMCVFKYTSTASMGCYYNEDEDPNSYKRIYAATYDTQTLPGTNDGIVSVDADGFTMRSTYANFAYIAVG